MIQADRHYFSERRVFHNKTSISLSTLHLHLGHIKGQRAQRMDADWSTDNDDPQDVSVASALEKETVIKDVVSLRDGLRGLMVRLTEVQGENEALKRDNEMLAVYIDNL